MKHICKDCGAHFEKDFNETLKSGCNFWGVRRLTNLPVTDKKILWEWMSKIPADEIFIRTGIQISMTLDAHLVDPRDTFAIKVPNWDKMPEAQQQEYEKIYFKMAGRGEKVTHDLVMSRMPIKFKTKKEPKEFIN